jgi:hypothetical protein
MRQTRPVAKKATRRSLDDEIAQLRDLDFDGLRARWKSLFRQQPPHLPRHLLFAVLAYRLQADALGDLDPTTARLLRQIATDGGTAEAACLTEAFDRRRTELKPGTNPDARVECSSLSGDGGGRRLCLERQDL